MTEQPTRVVYVCPRCEEVISQDDLINVEGGRQFCCDDCYDNYYFCCDSCEEIYDNDNGDWFEEEEVMLCNSCYSRRTANSSIGSPIISKTFKECRDKRFYGVEIEAEEGDRQKLYSFVRGSGWGLTDDGSLGSTGVEVISPKMNGDEGFKQIRNMCSYLEKAGFEPTIKAGVHVHFDFTNNKEEDVKKVVAGYYQYDDFFMRMLPESRRYNHYCEKLRSKFIILPVYLYGALDGVYKGNELEKNDKYSSIRYASLNFHSWYYRGTLEVRTHSSTINPEKIINWIKIHQRFFNYCLDKKLSHWLNHKPTLKEWKSIIGPHLFAYYNKRVKEFQKSKKVNNNDLKCISNDIKRMKKILSRTRSRLELCEIFRQE